MSESPDPEIARLSRECGELRAKVAQLEEYEAIVCGSNYAAVLNDRERLLVEVDRLERERDAAVAEAERLRKYEEAWHIQEALKQPVSIIEAHEVPLREVVE